MTLITGSCRTRFRTWSSLRRSGRSFMLTWRAAARTKGSLEIAGSSDRENCFRRTPMRPQRVRAMSPTPSWRPRDSCALASRYALFGLIRLLRFIRARAVTATRTSRVAPAIISHFLIFNSLLAVRMPTGTTPCDYRAYFRRFPDLLRCDGRYRCCQPRALRISCFLKPDNRRDSMWYLIHRRAVRPREEWTVSLDQHLVWMKEQHESGRILFSGPTADRKLGIYVIRAGSREESDRVAASDPYTRAGLCAFELFEWEVHQVLGAGPFTAAALRGHK